MNFFLSLFIFIGTFTLHVFIASAFGVNHSPPPPPQYNLRVSDTIKHLLPYYPQQQTSPTMDYIFVWLLAPEAPSLQVASQDQVEKALQNPKAVLLDARTDDEIIQGGFISVKGHRWVHASCTIDDCPLLIKTAESQLPDKNGKFQMLPCKKIFFYFDLIDPFSLPLAPVIVYCGTGKRAAQAQKTLETKGYSNVLNAGAYPNLGYLKNRS